MAIAAWIQKTSKGKEVPYWVMVEPVESGLRSKITLAAGIEVVIAAEDFSGKEIPGTRVRVLGHSDREGGMINGEVLDSSKMRKEQLGPLSVDFFPEKFNGYGDDIYALDEYNEEKLEEKGETFLEEIRGRLHRRREAMENPSGSKSREEAAAGKMLLEGMDDYGLLKVTVERVDNKRK